MCGWAGLTTGGVAGRVVGVDDIESMLRECPVMAKSTLAQLRNYEAALAHVRTHEWMEADTTELLTQIGRMNVLAISGGRVDRWDGGVLLPVGQGYIVAVTLDMSDMYIVERLLVKGGAVSVKGARSDVYFDVVGEVAYQASCYVNVEFP